MPHYDLPFREPLAPRSRLLEGLYQIGEVVGQGSFGLIYAAKQGSLGLPVAIKEFFPNGCWRDNHCIVAGPPWDPISYAESLRAFWQEGEMLEGLEHPGIVRVLSKFRANGTAYLVEELLEGVTMEVLVKPGPLPLAQVLEVARQVGCALQEVHAAGLVHSDLKPENLFATRTGQYVILDFGTARSYRDGAARAVATVSPGYSPLEQYTQQQKLTPAADVYALAATLYCLLKGAAPPGAPERSRGAPLAPLSGVPAAIQQALLDAMHLHPLRRTPAVPIFLDQLGIQPSHRSASTIQEFERVFEGYAHPGGVFALALCHQSGILCSAGRDGCFRIWSWPECKLLRGQKGHASFVTALAISHDGRHLVSGAQDGSIKLWSTRDARQGPCLVEGGPTVTSLHFEPADDFVIAALADGSCRLLGPTVDFTWQAHEGAVRGLDVDAAGQLLATGGGEHAVHFWRLPEGDFAGALATTESVRSVRFHHDGQAVLNCTGDFGVHLEDLESGREVRKFFGHRAEVRDAQFTCDPNLIVTVSDDHFLYGFRIDNGRLRLGSEVPEGLTGALAVDPESRLLATGGSDGVLRVWGF